MMWLISSFCVIQLYQLTRFCRLQCLIKLLLVFSVCYCVLNYDRKSADNVCLQLLAADCQERPLRNSNSAVCHRQPILASSCADWHTHRLCLMLNYNSAVTNHILNSFCCIWVTNYHKFFYDLAKMAYSVDTFKAIDCICYLFRTWQRIGGVTSCIWTSHLSP